MSMATKYDFKQIALMWRPGKGHRRICVGVITVHHEGSISFDYKKDGLDEAKSVDSSFAGYPGIPVSAKNVSNAQLSEVFFGRLINSARNDAQELYDFWLVDKNRIADNLYILAQTQGLSFSDMFEFVPQYFSTHRHSFITDIAGLSKLKTDLSKIKEGDKLTFAHEKDNPYDTEAVLICHNGRKVGYIKKGHNKVFNRKNTKSINVTVWSVNPMPGYESLYVKVDL